jgi:aspartyl-tRNA(Asn)/glutamyl-tRNA(Gln) amidotransferase subunit C
MKLTTNEVKYIAKLSKISLTDDEIELLRVDLSQILDYFSMLEKVDTENITPTGHVVETKTTLRKDISTPSQTNIEDILSNAPNRNGNMIQVKRIIE